MKNKIFKYLDKLYPIKEDCIDISFNKDIDNIIEILFGIINITFNDWIIARGYQQYGYLYPDGTTRWFQNGKLHRDNDKPARILSDGDKHWFQNGVLHRDNDKPAIIYSNGDKHW